MLIYSKPWNLLRTSWPKARHRGQSLMFPNPCFVGDGVRLTVTPVGDGRFAVEAVRPSDEAVLLTGEIETQ